ncbi:MAG: hypothetical protein JST30_09960 [Armatimonadetes bacterium]|nr:hypothetical protein [Armatimonadota bacterium]
MKNRLILSELRVLIEHYTTTKCPDPEFMRTHVITLAEAVDAWAADRKEGGTCDGDDEDYKMRA